MSIIPTIRYVHHDCIQDLARFTNRQTLDRVFEQGGGGLLDDVV